MSSISPASSPGTRSIADCIAKARRSSGRAEESAPRGALPTGVRTADTMTAFMIPPRGKKGPPPGRPPRLPLSIPEHLALLQQMLDTRQSSLLSAQRLERFPLQIQEILLGGCRFARDIAA